MKTRNHRTMVEGLVVSLEHMEVEIGTRGWHPYQVVHHPGGVAVLPLHEDGTVTLVRQLRIPARERLLELPAGRLDPGEEPEKCGLRELEEETGLRPKRVTHLGTIWSTPGFCDERIHLYVAEGLEQGETRMEAYEDIDVVRIPFAEALEMAADGRISDAKTIIALFRQQRRNG